MDFLPTSTHSGYGSRVVVLRGYSSHWSQFSERCTLYCLQCADSVVRRKKLFAILFFQASKASSRSHHYDSSDGKKVSSSRFSLSLTSSSVELCGSRCSHSLFMAMKAATKLSKWSELFSHRHYCEIEKVRYIEMEENSSCFTLKLNNI